MALIVRGPKQLFATFRKDGTPNPLANAIAENEARGVHRTFRNGLVEMRFEKDEYLSDADREAIQQVEGASITQEDVRAGGYPYDGPVPPETPYRAPRGTSRPQSEDANNPQRLDQKSQQDIEHQAATEHPGKKNR